MIYFSGLNNGDIKGKAGSRNDVMNEKLIGNQYPNNVINFMFCPNQTAKRNVGFLGVLLLSQRKPLSSAKTVMEG